MTSIDDAPDADDEDAHPGPEVNVGRFERGASITLGTALLALALSRRRPPGAFLLGLLGAYLSWRGATGHCLLYDALDTGSAEDEEDARLDAGGHDDVSLEATTTISRSPAEVYAFVRRLENAPRFLTFVDSVRTRDDTRSSWTGRAPDGHPVEWEAEILEDRPGELIVWRSEPGAVVHHAGAVTFRPTPGGQGTEVRLEIEYDPPGAPLGRAVAHVMGSSAPYPVEENLLRLRQILEGGETVTVRSQPQSAAGPDA
jgi:uncharacterized membrane protein